VKNVFQFSDAAAAPKKNERKKNFSRPRQKF